MTHIDIEKRLEGISLIAYDCSRGFRTVGIGFNMDSVGAKKVWEKLSIEEDFQEVYNKKTMLSMESVDKLFSHIWNWSEKQVKKRCLDPEINIDYNELREFHKFILLDIAYNIGSVSKWKKVFLNDKPLDILFEARRHPYEMMDSRVAKIGYQFGLINSIEDCKNIGIKFAKYLK